MNQNEEILFASMSLNLYPGYQSLKMSMNFFLLFFGSGTQGTEFESVISPKTSNGHRVVIVIIHKIIRW